MKHAIHKSYLLILFFLGLSFVYYSTFIKAENTLVSRLHGKILLQVEQNGEAWYVNQITNERHYMGRPSDAFNLMKNFGLGISNEDIKKITIAKTSFIGMDTDQDGLSDLLEDAIGTDKNKTDSDFDGFDDLTELIKGFNPNGEGEILPDNKFAKKQAGKILIQAEQNGEAWYINPDDNKRYFLGRPKDAFNIMRQTGLGIKNSDLNKIIAYTPNKFSNTKNTITTNNNKRKFTDSINNFSFEYPDNWKKTTIQGEKEATFIRNYENNLIQEKKAMIAVAFIENDDILELNKFKTAFKQGGIKQSSEIKKINNHQALKETFSFSNVNGQETTTYVQLNDKKMLMVTMFSAGNHRYHDSILGSLLRSIKYNN